MIADQQTPMTVAEVRALRQGGELSAAEYLRRVQDSRDATYWHRWAMRALLVLGAAHVLAGVVFFFAYNWEDLPPFTKFGILQAGVLTSFAAALLLRLEKPAGQAMLIAASVFTGVLFAVIGQVYQTGADVWELFAAWTLLTLPWALASKSSAHWLLWIILCLTAAGLYGAQVLVAAGSMTQVSLTTLVAVLPLLFLAIREIGLQSGLAWLEGNWFRRSLIVLSMVPLFGVALSFVLSTDSALPGFIVFLVVSAALGYLYLKVWPDFSVLALVVALASLLAMVVGGRVIFEVLEIGDPGTAVLGLLLLGAWCVFLTSAVVRLLNYLHKQLQGAGEYE